MSFVGQNLLQPRHAECGGDDGPLVGIKRAFYGKVTFLGIASVAFIPRCPSCLRLEARKGKGSRLLLAFCVAFLVSPLLNAHKSSASEYEVKAAYLFNFGRFVEWSDKGSVPKDGSFEICVLGQDPFGSALDATLAGTSLKGKSVVAKRISKAQEVNNCRVLYISSSEDSRWKEILDSLDKSNILTVSDLPHFSQRGGMIQFVLDGSKVRFEINLASAEEAGLSVSSELLKVAANVRRTPHTGE
jgi:hypothetical protein